MYDEKPVSKVHDAYDEKPASRVSKADKDAWGESTRGYYEAWERDASPPARSISPPRNNSASKFAAADLDELRVQFN